MNGKSVQENQNVQLSSLLERAGFEKMSRPGWVTWVFTGNEFSKSEKTTKKSRKKKAFDQKNLWSVRHVEVTERKGVYQLTGLRLNLDYNRLRDNLVRACRKFFGARTTPTIVECGRGTFWVLLEFVKSGTKKKQIRQQAADYMPYGVAGFKIGIGAAAGNIEIYFSEFFGIGFIPQAFATAHMRIVLEALELRKHIDKVPGVLEQRSVFETIVSPKVSLLLALGEQSIDAQLSQFIATRDRPLPFSIRCSGESVDFEMGEGVANYDPRLVPQVPVVVLESRERVDGLREIDALLVDGKISRASRAISDATRLTGPTTYLQQRLNLLAVCGQDIAAEVVESLEALAPVERKLFLSHKVRSSALAKRMDLVLEHLSELGKLLSADVPDIDSIKSFDLVVPELLGDAWAPINSRKAEACYERILQRCGDLPRILRKIISLTASDVDDVREFRLLTRLAQVERRKNELAAIYFRLAQLAHKNKSLHSDPVDLASKSLQNDRNHYQSALLTASLLADAKKPNEAIALLDQMLADSSVTIPPLARADLEYAIGQMWMSSLGRQDLAERRFERAIALNDCHVESLASLERIYREMGYVEKTSVLLEKQFDAFERSGALDQLKRVFDELVEMFRGPLNQPKKAYELYQRMIALEVVEPEEIDRLMAWRDIEIDWSSIYEKLSSNLSNLPSGLVSARYHMRLAEICRDKTDNPDGALVHYCAALEHGGIDGIGFRYIVEVLTGMHDLERLGEAYEARIKQVKGQERSDLIGELLAVPGVLSDARRDQLAAEAYVADEDNASFIFQRLKFYQSMDDVDGIESLGNVIEQFVTAPGKLSTWLRNLIDTVLDCVDPAKFRVADHLYRKLYEIDVDPVGILAEAISTFKDTMDAGRSAFYLRELLKRDSLPDLSSKLVARHLVGFDADLAKYHLLRATSAANREDICSDARVAFAIYKRLPGHDKLQEKALHLFGQHDQLTDSELKDLYELSLLTENWLDAAKVYQRQSELTSSREGKARLLIDQGRMLWKDARDHGRARLAYVMALNFVENKAPIKMVLAQLAEESGQQEQELRALVDYVLDGDSLLDAVVYHRAVNRMLALGKEPYSIYKLIRSQLAAAAADEDSKIVLSVSETLISSGLLNQELFVLAFRAAVTGRFADDAVDYWWRGLRSVQNRTGIRSYLSETQAILKTAGRDDLLIKCFRSAIQNGVTSELPESVSQEILVQYGLVLFDSDIRRGKALPIFKEAYKNEPSDNRTWLPIYFILEEQGDRYQQYLFLKEMIVRLRADVRPLRQYPITVESLEKQFQELAAEYGDQQISNSFGNVSEDLVVSSEGTGLSVISNVEHDYEMEMPQARVAGDSVEVGPVVEKSAAQLSLVSLPEDDDAESDQIVVAEAEEDSTQIFVQSSSSDIDISDVALDVAEPVVAVAIDWNLASVQPVDAPEDQPDEVAADLHAPDAIPSFDISSVDVSEVTMTFGDESAESADAVVPPPPMDAVSSVTAEPSLDFDSAPIGIDFADIANAVSALPMEPVTLDEVQQPVFSLDSPDDSERADAQDEPSMEGSFDPTAALNVAVAEMSSEPVDSSSVELSAAFSGVVPGAESLVGGLGAVGDSQIAVGETSMPPPPDLEPSQISMQMVNSSLDHGESQVADIGDWRRLVLSGAITEDLTEKIMRKAFANEVEKHIAIQAIALIAGNCDLLDSWHWRVWRNSKEYGYPVIGKDRYNSETTSPALQSPLHQLVMACNPLIAKVFRERYTLAYVAKALGTTVPMVEKVRREVSWKDGILHDAGLHLFQDRIAKRGYRAFVMNGLGGTVFFDGPNKSIYFDESWFSKHPPSILFNRISVLLWSIRLQYVIPLALDPKKQALPFFLEVFQKLEQQGISRFAERLTSKSTIGKYLSSMDVRSLRALKQRSGNPTESHMTALWFAMQEHVYKMILSETLDVVGLLEAITKSDLTKPGALKLNEIYKKSPYAKSILQYVTKLIL